MTPPYLVHEPTCVTAQASGPGVELWFHEQMQVGVLGPLVTVTGGAHQAPRGQRPRDLLAVLVQRRGRPVSAATLLDAVWGDQAHTLSATAVHTVVARLRGQVGQDAILTHDAGYVLPRESTSLDEDDFTETVERARSHVSRAEPKQAIQAYRAALRLWRGDLAYEGVSDDVVAASRVRLDDLRVSAMEELAAILLDGHEADLIAEANTISAELCLRNPLRDHSHELAMLASYRAGRQADALEIYREFRARVRRELGIEPAPALSALHERLLRHEVVTDPAAAALARSPSRTRSRPPAPRTILVGQERTLAEIKRAHAGGRRLLTLVGPGGVGKSRLLQEVGRVLTAEDIAWVELCGLDDAALDDLVDAFGTACGTPPGVAGTLDGLVTALATAQLTVLVDEAEWHLDLVGQVLGALLDHCPGIRVIVTSRRPLDIPGERLIPVSPLDTPAADADLETIAGAPAVRLLLERLADHGMPLRRDEASMAIAAQIARRLDGLPLALEIVAGHAGSRSLPDLATLVERPHEVVDDRPSTPARHRSVRETVLWSMANLDPTARRALIDLSVIVGTFDLPTAAAITALAHGEAVEATVIGLVREGLVQPVRDRGSHTEYRLLRTVRAVAGEDLGENGRNRAAARHRQWYAARWRDQPRSDALLEDVRHHYDDYLTALRSALALGDGPAICDLTVTLSRLWLFANWQAGVRWSRRAAEHPSLDERSRALVLAQCSTLMLYVDLAHAERDARQAIPVLRTHGERLALITAMLGLTLSQLNTGQVEAAVASADAAVAEARHATPARLADALGAAAATRASIGDIPGTLAAVREALDILDEVGSVSASLAVGCNLAFALTDIDRPRDAITVLERVAPDIPGLLGIRTTGVYAFNLAWALLADGQGRRALEVFHGLVDGPVATIDTELAEALLGAALAVTLVRPELGPRAVTAALTISDRVGFTAFGPAIHRALNNLAPEAEADPEELLPTGSLALDIVRAAASALAAPLSVD